MDDNGDELIGLAQVPRALRELMGDGAPSYGALYRDAVNGRVPVEHRRGRWYARRHNLPVFAAHFSSVQGEEQPPRAAA